MKPIKVLLVLDTLAIAGIQQQILTLVKNFDKSRIHPVVCTLFSRNKDMPEPLADEIIKHGVKVEKLAMVSWRDFKTVKNFLHIIKENNIDIIHGNSAQVDFWACFLGKLFTNCKTVYTKHNIREIEPITNNIPILQYWLLNHFLTDKIISVSNAVKSHLINYYKIDKNKVATIYNPIDLNIFNKKHNKNVIRNQLGISNNIPLIGGISRFLPRKGWDIFLKTASYVIKKIPDAHFIIVGWGKDEKKLKLLSKKLGIEKNIHWLIARRDINDILNSLDIFLFTPLWREGFGIVLIEAMACSLPVVGTNVGPLPEIIIDGETGFIPSPKDWQLEIKTADSKKISEKIIWLINNNKEAKNMGAKGKKRVQNKFSAKLIADQTSKLYSEILNN